MIQDVSAGERRSERVVALAGLAVLLSGIGFGRFAYTALVPALIEEGWLDRPGAGLAAAANFAGYFIGALAAGRIGRALPFALVVRTALVATVLAFAACAVDLGFAWLAVWRFVVGVTGAVTMVLVPMTILAAVPHARRPGTVGLMFTGIGLGIAFSGTMVPWLASLGVASAWTVLAALAAVLTIATWRVWVRMAPPAPPSERPSAKPGLARGGRWPIGLLVLAYALDAAGFVPHTVFWVDFAARYLDLGLGVGGMLWVLFGLGAMAGPTVVSRVAARIGFARAFSAILLVKAAAVALPLATTSLAALAVSSMVVGALTPGIASLGAGRVAELAAPGRQGAAWGWMTTAFAATQAASASGYAFLLKATESYYPLFTIGAGLLGLGVLLAVISDRLSASDQ